jgi:hypothetical protein
VRHRADGHLQHEPREAEEVSHRDDLGGHLVDASHEQRAARRAQRLEVGARGRRPAALAADMGLGRVKTFVDIGFERPSEKAGIMGLATP